MIDRPRPSLYVSIETYLTAAIAFVIAIFLDVTTSISMLLIASGVAAATYGSTRFIPISRKVLIGIFALCAAVVVVALLCW